jgi:hypothetical protein
MPESFQTTNRLCHWHDHAGLAGGSCAHTNSFNASRRKTFSALCAGNSDRNGTHSFGDRTVWLSKMATTESTRTIISGFTRDSQMSECGIFGEDSPPARNLEDYPFPIQLIRGAHFSERPNHDGPPRFPSII